MHIADTSQLFLPSVIEYSAQALNSGRREVASYWAAELSGDISNSFH
jgi:hypothetical protein